MHPLLKIVPYFSNHPNLIELVQLLILNGVDLNANTERNCSPALHSLSKNAMLSDRLKIDIVRLLLQIWADVEIQHEITPLHNFCLHCRTENLVEIPKPLIQTGTDVNARYQSGDAPIHLLCWNSKKGDLVISSSF